MVKTITLLLLSFSLALGQNPNNIHLKSGSFIPEENFEKSFQNEVNDEDQLFVVQFSSIPSSEERKQIEAMGLVFEDYLPTNAYLVYTPKGLRFSSLNNFNVRSIFPFESSFKVSKEFTKEIPSHARQGGYIIRLSILTHSNASSPELIEAIQQFEAQIVQTPKTGNLYSIDIPENRINELLDLNMIKWVEYIQPDPVPDDLRGRTLHRANAIDRPSSNGYHYDGTGVSVALADDGPVGPHIDLQGRIVQVGSMGADGTHGDMTVGILMGAGNLIPINAGMATGVTMRYYDIFPPSGSSYDHINSAVTNYITFGTVITSTSYSEVGSNNYGIYNSTAQSVDQQTYQNPSIIHVFSAGNAGPGFGTITGGMKAAKSTIATANLDYKDDRTNSSSRGPAADGRVKPDISANGTNQESLDANNGYSPGGGTSAACPGIAGILSQLYQAHRELNAGADPKSSLMKAILLNSAEDLGNPGPDYSFGWGRVNTLRALKTMEENRFMEDSLSQGDSATHSITVPAGVSELKVMVYWLDKEGSPSANQALVNNLDMTLEDPSNNIWQPWILNPSNPSAIATRGIDNLNNMEQVTLSSPAAGSYSVKVKGTSVPFGPQNYHVIYEFSMADPQITYPLGGESLVAGQIESIRWDAGSNLGTFTLEYSIDSGATWTLINSNISGSSRTFNWNIPSGLTSDKTIIRITNGSLSDQSDAVFTILDIPTNLSVISSCADSAQLMWGNVAGADAYIVRKLGGQYMDSVAFTASNSVFVNNVDANDPDVWFSVQAVTTNTAGNVVNGYGRRANAIRKQTGLYNCPSESPIAQFSADTSALCVGRTVKFNNETINGSNSFLWTFTPSTVNFVNGTNQNSSDPEVQFLSDDSYSAKLEAFNPGGNDVEEKVAFVNPTFPASTLNEDFQAGLQLPSEWEFESGNGQFTWDFITLFSGANNTGTIAAYYDRYLNDNLNEENSLISKPVDISSFNNPILIFDVACTYQQNTPPNIAGGLRIDISEDCGYSFQNSSYYKRANDLATAPYSTTFWTPADLNDWRKDTVDLSSYSGNLQFKFVNVGGFFGNSLFLDNVEVIENPSVGLSDENYNSKFILYPNPTTGVLNIDAKNLEGRKYIISVIDSKGSSLIEKSINSSKTSFNLSLDLSNLSSGLYTIKILGENSISINKVSYIKN